jgi:hypothetical protein
VESAVFLAGSSIVIFPAVFVLREFPQFMLGVWYFSSENAQCEHWLHKTKGGETTCYYSMVAAAVKPGDEPDG